MATNKTDSTVVPASVYKNIKLPDGPDAILNRIRGMVQESEEYITNKKTEMELGWDMYRNHARDGLDGDIKGNTTWIVIDAMMAITSVFGKTVSFEAIDEKPLSKEKAEYLDRAFENDWTFGRYQSVHRAASLNKFLSGAGIVYNNRFNERLLIPEFVSVPPESMLFDPQGGTDLDRARWCGAAMVYSLQSMKLDKEFVADAVKHFLTYGGKPAKDGTQREAEEAKNRVSDKLTVGEDGSVRDEKDGILEDVPCFDIYLPLPDKKSGKSYKWLFTVDQGVKYIFRARRLDPITDDERTDPTLVEYPFVLENFASMFGNDPIGMSLPQLTKDKQVFHATTLNTAKRIWEQNADLKQVVAAGAVSPEQLKGRDPSSILELDLEGAQISTIRDAVMQMQQHPINMADAERLMGLVERDLQKATGVNDIVLSEPSPSGERLGQTELRAQRTNTRTKAQLNVVLEGMQGVAKKWYNSYRRNYKGLSTIRKKEMSIQVGVTRETFTITKSDFDGKVPQIKVSSELVEAEKNRERVAALATAMPYIQASGDIGKFNAATREMLRATGLFADDVLNTITAVDLMSFWIDVQVDLLSANVPVQLLDTDPVKPRLERMLNIPTDAGRAYAVQLLQRADEEMLQAQVAQETGLAENEVVGDGSAKATVAAEPEMAGPSV